MPFKHKELSYRYGPFIALSLRYAFLFIGVFIMSNGIIFLVQSDLGVDPWNVFHIGIAMKTGLRLGNVIQATSLVLISFSYLLKIKPRVGTLVGIYFVGYFVDLINSIGYVSKAETIISGIILNFLGIAFFGIGTAFYISTNLGAGPRDGMMLALTRVFKRRIGFIRTVMELVIATVGYLIGGPIGLGTAFYCLLIGWFIELGLFIVKGVKSFLFFNEG